MSFEEIAQLASTKRKHFAIVLVDPNCPLCRQLYRALHDTTGFASEERVIFNIVDITRPENRWYQQFLFARSQPTTLVFSPEARLKAVSRGASQASTECIINALHGSSSCAKYHASVNFPESVSHEDIIETLNLVLTAKRKVESGKDATAELEKALNTLYYPFPLWLQIRNEKNLGNAKDAIFFARQLLTFQSMRQTMVYSDLFLAARQMVDPDFDIATMPMLEIESSEIHLGELQKGDKVDIRIKITNSGKETLVVYDVSVGCSCLTLQSEISSEMEAGDKEYLHLLSTAEQQGEIQREVRVANSGLTSTQTINIRASVK
jgi:hypothetical protein